MSDDQREASAASATPETARDDAAERNGDRAPAAGDNPVADVPANPRIAEPDTAKAARARRAPAAGVLDDADALADAAVGTDEGSALEPAGNGAESASADSSPGAGAGSG